MPQATPTEPATPTPALLQPRHRVFINAPAARDVNLDPSPAPVRDWLAALLDSKHVEIKRDGRSRLVRADHATGRWVLKRVDQPQPILGIYRAVRMTPAWRELRAAERMHAAGVRVVRPVVIAHDARGQLTVMPFVEAHALQGVIESLTDIDQRLRIARAVGEQVGRVTAAGVINRDHKPMNLLIDDDCRLHGGSPVLIDALLRRRSDRRVLRMLNTLIRASLRTGEVSVRERVACLRAAIAADPTLAPDGRAAPLARRIKAIYIPADEWPT